MERMAEIAEEMGVEIRTGEEVCGIDCRGRRAVAVQTKCRTFPADSLVINADFAEAMRQWVPNAQRRRWTDERIAKKRFSCSTFMLYLGIDCRYDHLAHHTIYLTGDYRRNLREIETDHVLSDEPSLYVQNACVTDPSLAPDGKSTLYVLAPVSHLHPNIDWGRECARFRAVVLRQLARRLGLKDLEGRIRYERIVTPLDWQRQFAIYRGATFSMAHNLGQMLHFRPHNRFEDLDGVYLVGGGTHPGSGLPVIFESARISSRLLLDDLGVDRSWIDVPPRPESSRGALPALPSKTRVAVERW
jgi:phytoene desaturase